MTPTEKILDKLGKIKAHMDSAKAIGSEAEAQAFAALLQNLLAKHKLEMSDLQYSSHLEEEPVEQYPVGGGAVWDNSHGKAKKVLRNYPEVEVTSKRVAWCERLCNIIARAHSCQMIVHTRSSQLSLVGRKSDVEVAEYLFVTMQRTAEKLAHKEYKRFRMQTRQRDNGGGRYLHETHGFKAAWLSGFITRLGQRFEEEKQKMQGAYASTALVRINKEAKAVEDYIEAGKQKGALVKSKGVRGHGTKGNMEGYKRGREAAEGLNLKANAVKEGQANKQIE